MLDKADNIKPYHYKYPNPCFNLFEQVCISND